MPRLGWAATSANRSLSADDNPLERLLVAFATFREPPRIGLEDVKPQAKAQGAASS